jgi:hypothetical protein
MRMPPPVSAPAQLVDRSLEIDDLVVAREQLVRAHLRTVKHALERAGLWQYSRYSCMARL